MEDSRVRAKQLSQASHIQENMPRMGQGNQFQNHDNPNTDGNENTYSHSSNSFYPNPSNNAASFDNRYLIQMMRINWVSLHS